ncbi:MULTISPECIES: PDR/VanB family oxidoreductase [unclassified Cupriavidus]|uniref:PDR/VanB family oxidoreductase n=1 Tax=unclassified Cupriavidus TaxID=2640874 RepID=UPI00040CCBD3|nr:MULTISPECIES: PDR/VanB family oxidoreductase [unclassified Cupriavidus]MBP0627644.1 oxidoreductase [Cupriavidus sp. AcVe19-1a]
MTTNSLEVSVIARERAASDIVRITLAAPDGEQLPEFAAGSHIDVHVDAGLVRQYSLINHPGERGHYVIGVLLDGKSRGGSKAIHSDFHVGRSVRIGSPRCNFPLLTSAKHSILFAGGIGITPILSMARELSARGQSYTLHYCCRSRDKAAFLEEIAALDPGEEFRLHLDDGTPDQRFVLADCLPEMEPDTHMYICGPEGFINHVVGGAEAAGWPASQVHVERFSANVDVTGDSFVVVAARSQAEVVVSKEETIVQALARVGIAVPVSCEQGVCGTCLTRVIEGKPDHRDMFQTDEEKEADSQCITPCCSRSMSGRLVLDL